MKEVKEKNEDAGKEKGERAGVKRRGNGNAEEERRRDKKRRK